jgi:hypothetical protein
MGRSAGACSIILVTAPEAGNAGFEQSHAGLDGRTLHRRRRRPPKVAGKDKTSAFRKSRLAVPRFEDFR